MECLQSESFLTDLVLSYLAGLYYSQNFSILTFSVCDNSFCPVSWMNKEIRLLKNIHNIAGLRLLGTDLLLCGTGVPRARISEQCLVTAEYGMQGCVSRGRRPWVKPRALCFPFLELLAMVIICKCQKYPNFFYVADIEWSSADNGMKRLDRHLFRDALDIQSDFEELENVYQGRKTARLALDGEWPRD